MQYKVELYRSEEGFAVCCPALPGCWSQGVDEVDALKNIQSAITDYLEVTAEMEAEKEVRYVEVAAS